MGFEAQCLEGDFWPNAGHVADGNTDPDHDLRRAFPEEARKIHYGETEERHIYGEATLKDVRELVEEGVEIAPLPPDLSEAN